MAYPKGCCVAHSEVQLFHSVPLTEVDAVLKEGLAASSAFDDLDLDMRQGVVFCWLCQEHDKMWGKNPDYVYLGVTVDQDRCRVAEMDFASIAMMYRQGSGGKPVNIEAARLLAELYQVTSVPLSEYQEGMLWTPEVLVKGDIEPGCVRQAQALSDQQEG